VAPIEARTDGKPLSPGARVKASTVRSRPATSTRSPRTWTKRSRREKKFESVKNRPVNSKENGMVGNPAAPTVAPGGRVAVVAWTAVAPAAAGGGVLVPPPPLSSMERKSTPLRLAATSSWTTRERMSSSFGTALPSRITEE
jgi:hypothetical protein